MKSISIILVFIIISFAGYSQKTERYSGEYFNGGKIKGTANFAYYLGDKGKKIKHGPFRYSARDKGQTWRFSQNISGEYTNGNKNGNWTYNLNSKEVKRDKNGYFYDITIDMTAEYINGFPNGEWVYDCYINKYKKVMKSGRLRKTASTVSKSVKIVLNWNKGKLVDSLIIIDKLGSNIIASMNEYGVLTNDFTIEGQNINSRITYNKGIESSRILNGKKIDNLEYIAYLSLEDKDSKVKKQKMSLCDNQNCIILKYLRDNIFNNEYFLYRFIEGDKILHSENDYNDYNVVYKGLYYYNLEPKATVEEQKVFKEIEVAYEKTKEALWYNKRALAKSPKDKKILADKRRIQGAINQYKIILCHLSAYKKYLSLQNIQDKSNCKSIKFSTTPISRAEYLDELKHQSDLQYKILKSNNQYH